MTSVAVGLRLPRQAWTRYSAAAQGLGIPLGTYLRQRLDEKDRLDEQLAALRTELERRMTSEPAAGGSPTFAAGLLVEVLLMLRMVVGPQNATVARKEVERRGLETWR
jgi:hypothetical protein